MKILFVSNGFPPSGLWGTEFYTHQVATGLAARGHACSVLHPVRDGSKPRYTLERRLAYGLPIWALHNAGDPQKSFADSYENARVERVFGDILAELEPDVVHFTHFLWGLSARLPSIARARGAATVVTITDFGLLCHRGQLFDSELKSCHGPCSAEVCARCVREPGPYDATPAGLVVKRAAVRSIAAAGGLGLVVRARDIERRRSVLSDVFDSVDRWIAPTEVVAAKFARHGVPEARMSRLVYGIDEERFQLDARARDTRIARFGFLGQFAPHKGLDRLIDAARLLARDVDGPWEIELHGHVSEGRNHRYFAAMSLSDLRERVRWMGSFEPLRAPEILARLSAVVVPSRWVENAPLTVLQARAAGVPVIASDVPGIREVMQHGVHGLLVPRDDSQALSAAMRDVIEGRFPRRVRPDPIVRQRDHLNRIEAIHRSAVRARGRPACVAAVT